MQPMDELTSSWILEFLLRQPIDDWIVNSLLTLLPIPKHDPRLHKTISVRKISSDLSKASLTENTLDSLEKIRELDRASGINVKESMKKAYWAVAVESTARIWRETSLDRREDLIKAAMDRIWNRRVARVMRLGNEFGLASDRLKDMLVALSNPESRELVLGRDILTFALDSVKAYLKDAMNEMGPPFLEIAAASIDLSSYDDKDGEANKVKDAPTSSSASPHAVVEDPLLSALKMVTRAASDMERKRMR